MSFTGKRGRKALTPEQKAAKNRVAGRGSPLAAPTAMPFAPEELNLSAVTEWLRIGEYLKLTDRVALVDQQALVAYCSGYALYCDAIAKLLIDHEPYWGLSNKRPKPSVYATIAATHGREVLRFARKFGMTARCRHLDQRVTGRPATPQEIHNLRGTEKRRKPSRGMTKSAEFSAKSVMPPRCISSCEAAQREWVRLVEQLESLDLWTPLDVAAVTICVSSFALVLSCCEKLKDEESEPMAIATGEGAASQNPLLEIRSKHLELCEDVWKDYGMSPYDRLNFSRIDGGDDVTGKPRFKLFPDE